MSIFNIQNLTYSFFCEEATLRTLYSFPGILKGCVATSLYGLATGRQLRITLMSNIGFF